MASSDCRAFRLDSIAQPDRLRGPDGPSSGDGVSGAPWLEARHDLDCAACAAWLARQRKIVGLIGQLDRFAAPEELDRAAADAVAADQRRTSALAALEPSRAPHVLRRLVQEEVDAGASAVVARALAGLERRTAPAELEQLVRERLAANADGGPVPLEFGPRGLRPALRIGLVAAAALAILALPPLLSPQDAARDFEPRARLTMVSSPDQLSPMASALALGLSGGLPMAQGASPEGGSVDRRERAR